tara:strand:- start:10834 stop:12705 length:1872 start_codon:yes stop_codon:yes gene_type:complete
MSHSVGMEPSPASRPDNASRFEGRTPWSILVVAWIVLSLAGMLLAGETARRQSEAELAQQTRAGAALHAAVLRSELEKHRSLPLVLAQDPEVIGMLRAAPTDRTLVSHKLETLADRTRAAAIYVLDTRGTARAASNWNLPTSFVGSNYSFRPYFKEAMASGSAEFFALGTVSGRPGLYLARRVDAASGPPLGVVVVKVEFDSLEAEWRGSGEPAFVTDPRGVVLVTSVPTWRFRTIAPMDPASRSGILTGRTLDGDALAPLPFRADTANPTPVVVATIQGVSGRWMTATAATSTPGWTLHLLSPVGDAIRATVISARAVAGLIITLIFGAAAVLLRRRQQGLAQARADERARHELERLVQERTAELSAANRDLSHEIEERHRVEASREALRDDLVQATKLATLGQIAAGVAHEINQPVAAIRTHSDSAAAYLDKADAKGVRRMLDRIGELTARIGSITGELRAFSRKTTARIGPTDPDAAIDGALLLLGGRLRQQRVKLVREPGPDGVRVLAEQIRLEQVIVNLIQNALESLEQNEKTAGPATLTLSVIRHDATLDIAVMDNGTGLTPEVAAQLFTPFVTTKASGLGLGLVICRDIIAAFGGELVFEPSDIGARFVIRLKVAP